MEQVTLYCDGASRGNPGPGSFGFVILEEGRIVAQGKGRLGNVTNNFAEYQALIQGLQKCLTLGATSIVVKSDSQLLVRQLNGQYRVKAPQIRPLYEEAATLLRKFPESKVHHIPREENSLADALANAALDE